MAEDADIILTYVIKYPGTNLTKVGQAKYFVDRFAQFETASPVDPQVVWVFRGAKHERAFHKRFEHLRTTESSYYYTRELREYIHSRELKPYRLTRAEAEGRGGGDIAPCRA